MKTIENLDLYNMVLIEKYLNNQMDHQERKDFRHKLRHDEELRTDFDMVVESYKHTAPHKWLSAKEEVFFDSFNNHRLPDKATLAKNIVHFGLIGIVIATALLAFCALVLVVIG